MSEAMEKIELCKENVKPAARGRRAASLSRALGEITTSEGSAPSNSDLTKKHEAAVEAAKAGEDPIKPWLAYVSWAQDAYPSNGSDSPLLGILERVTAEFKADERYRNDRTYVQLWVAYVRLWLGLYFSSLTPTQAELVPEPADLFKFMYANKIGEDVALFYMTYAWLAESRKNFSLADKIYTKGIRRRAQPLDRLKTRFKAFQARMSRRWIRFSESQDGEAPTDIDLALLSGVSRRGGENAAPGRDRDTLGAMSKHRAARTHRAPSGPPAPRGGLPSSTAAPAFGSRAAPTSNSMPLVFVDDAFRDGGVGGSDELAEPAPGASWNHLAPEAERTKENADKPSVWAGTTLPAHAGVHREVAVPAPPSFEVFVDEGLESTTAPTGGPVSLKPRADGFVSDAERIASNPLAWAKGERPVVAPPPPPPETEHAGRDRDRDHDRRRHRRAGSSSNREMVREYNVGMLCQESKDDQPVRNFEECRAAAWLAANPIPDDPPAVAAPAPPVDDDDAMGATPSAPTPAITRKLSFVDSGGKASDDGDDDDDDGMAALAGADKEDFTINTRMAMQDLDAMFCDEFGGDEWLGGAKPAPPPAAVPPGGVGFSAPRAVAHLVAAQPPSATEKPPIAPRTSPAVPAAAAPFTVFQDDDLDVDGEEEVGEEAADPAVRRLPFTVFEDGGSDTPASEKAATRLPFTVFEDGGEEVAAPVPPPFTVFEDVPAAAPAPPPFTVFEDAASPSPPPFAVYEDTQELPVFQVEEAGAGDGAPFTVFQDESPEGVGAAAGCSRSANRELGAKASLRRRDAAPPAKRSSTGEFPSAASPPEDPDRENRTPSRVAVGRNRHGRQLPVVEAEVLVELAAPAPSVLAASPEDDGEEEESPVQALLAATDVSFEVYRDP